LVLEVLPTSWTNIYQQGIGVQDMKDDNLSSAIANQTSTETNPSSNNETSISYFRCRRKGIEKRPHRISVVEKARTVFQSHLGRGRWKTAQVAAAILIGLSGMAMAQTARLDSTFASGGIFLTHDTQAFDAVADAVALQSDGKIVVGGEISSLAGVLRLDTNGTLDSNFGTGGMVTINVPSGLGGGVQVVGVAIQIDGKIIAGISTINSGGPKSFSLARLNPNGSLDNSFGSAGLVTTSLFGQQRSPTVIALQPDGRILLAGDGVMARYESNGQLDSGFGSSGFALLTAFSVRAIALQANGQILVGSGGPARDTFPPSTQTSSVAGVIARYNPNGSLDNSFGGIGQVASVVPVSAIAVQSDGRIIAAGGITAKLVAPPAGNDTGFGLVRYNPNGSIDLTFGRRGVVITDFGQSGPLAEAFALALQPNGDIVAAGVAGQKPVGFQSAPSSFGLARYTSIGLLDTSFGSVGRVTTSFGTNTASISALVLQSDGKIVVAGNSGASSQQSFVNNIVVARYLAN
jgi:uncharacterized delta-60 repeat protein